MMSVIALIGTFEAALAAVVPLCAVVGSDGDRRELIFELGYHEGVVDLFELKGEDLDTDLDEIMAGDLRRQLIYRVMLSGIDAGDIRRAWGVDGDPDAVGAVESLAGTKADTFGQLLCADEQASSRSFPHSGDVADVFRMVSASGPSWLEEFKLAAEEISTSDAEVSNDSHSWLMPRALASRWNRSWSGPG